MSIESPADTNTEYVVQWEPPEEKWGELARDIVMWLYMNGSGPHVGKNLYTHLRNLGRRIPNWLKREIPDSNTSPPKGAVAVAIYKAILVGDNEHPSCPGYEEQGDDEKHTSGKGDPKA